MNITPEQVFSVYNNLPPLYQKGFDPNQVMTSIQLFSDHVILPDSEHTLSVSPALITLQDQWIQEVEPMSRKAFEALPQAENTQDLGALLLGPSFVNGHTHLAMSSLRGIGQEALKGNVVEDFYYAIEKHLTPEDVRAFVRMGAYESLLCGVTGVWEHYYYAQDIAKALQEVGICGVVAPTLQDIYGPGYQRWGETIEDTLSIHENTALQDKGVYAALGPHATDTVSTGLWQNIRELAETHDLVIHSHIAQSIEEYQRAMDKHGTTPIQYLEQQGILELNSGVILVHSLFVTHDDIACLDPRYHTLAYCPLSQIQFAFPANISPWQKAGIPIQVGTDAGCCNDTMNVQQELRVLAGGRAFGVTQSPLYQAFQNHGSLAHAQAVHHERVSVYEQGASLAELLNMVWQVPGQRSKALNMGVIQPGARANLNVWDLKHPSLWPANDPLRSLVMCDASQALSNVMVNGRWVAQPGSCFQDHVLLSHDFNEAHKEASERLEKLLERL